MIRFLVTDLRQDSRTCLLRVLKALPSFWSSFYRVLLVLSFFFISYRVLPSFTELWISYFMERRFTEFLPSYQVLGLDIFTMYPILPSFTEFYRVLPSFTEFYRVLPSFSLEWGRIWVGWPRMDPVGSSLPSEYILPGFFFVPSFFWFRSVVVFLLVAVGPSLKTKQKTDRRRTMSR